jgi:hypothetical protein
MKIAVLLVLIPTALVIPVRARAAEAGVPHACRSAIAARWPFWRLSPPPRDYAAYAKQERIETNVASADFDDDGTRDTAVLLLTSATTQAQQRLAICLTRGSQVELHVIREPYCADGIVVVPKGSKAYDYERGDVVRYRTNGVHALYFEKAGATYLFERGRLRRVIDSD